MDEETVSQLRDQLREAMAIIDLLAEADPTDDGMRDWKDGTDRWYLLRKRVSPDLLPDSASTNETISNRGD